MLKQYLHSFPKKLLKLQLFQMLFPDLILEILFLLEYVIVESCLTLLHVGARSRDSSIYKKYHSLNIQPLSVAH